MKIASCRSCWPGRDTGGDEADAGLRLFGIGDLKDRLPGQISGGQAQRAVLARAVATAPRLLVADEPTGQLDRVTGAKVMEAPLRWSGTAGCALLIASHDPEVASRLAIPWTIERGQLTCSGGVATAASSAGVGNAA